MYLSHYTITDSIFLSDSVQNFMGGIEEGARVNIMAWLDPFCFEDSPQRLGDIQMMRVWRKIKDIETASSPFLNHFPHLSTSMDTGIVKAYEGWPSNCQREVVDGFRHILSLDALTVCKTVINIVPAYHAENIEPCGFHGRHKDILPGELPAVRHISFVHTWLSSPK